MCTRDNNSSARTGANRSRTSLFIMFSFIIFIAILQLQCQVLQSWIEGKDQDQLDYYVNKNVIVADRYELNNEVTAASIDNAYLLDEEVEATSSILSTSPSLTIKSEVPSITPSSNTYDVFMTHSPSHAPRKEYESNFPSHAPTTTSTTTTTTNSLNDRYQVIAPIAKTNTSRNPLLPKRIILITGLESSGTKIITEAIAVATGAYNGHISSSGNSFHGRMLGNDIEVQHQSLPWGSTCTDEQDAKQLHTMPVLVPRQCGCSSRMNSFIWDTPICDAYNIHPSCIGLGLSQRLPYPNRFFVNITSHIRWYEDRGVESTAVIVLRDKDIEETSKYRDHCTNNALVHMENKHGLKLITEALKQLSMDKRNSRSRSASLVLVSYESMMSLGKEYLTTYVYDRLGITNIDAYVPALNNGNQKYTAHHP